MNVLLYNHHLDWMRQWVIKWFWLLLWVKKFSVWKYGFHGICTWYRLSVLWYFLFLGGGGILFLFLRVTIHRSPFPQKTEWALVQSGTLFSVQWSGANAGKTRLYFADSFYLNVQFKKNYCKFINVCERFIWRNSRPCINCKNKYL